MSNYLSSFPGELPLDEFHTLAAVVNCLQPPYGGRLALEAMPEKGKPKHNPFGDIETSAIVTTATLVYAEPAVNYAEDRKTYDFDCVSPLAVAIEVAGMAFPDLVDYPQILENEIYRIIETL